MFDRLKKYVARFQSQQHTQSPITFDRRGILSIPHRKGVSSDADGGSNSMALYRPGGTNSVDATKAMDAYTQLTFAAIRAISDEIANTQFRLYQIKASGDHEEVYSHELLDALEGVNENMTGPEFKHMIAAHLELAGNCYILLEGVKSFDDKPKALYLLNPAGVSVKLDKSSFPYKLLGYRFKYDGKEMSFQPYEIIHLKYPNPSDPWTGIGTVQGIAEWIDLDNYLMDFNKNFFRNGARLNGVLTTAMTTEEQLFNLKISFEEQYAGVKNAYKTVALPKGVDFKPTQAQAKDMDFPNLAKEIFDRVLAGFRVSRTILGTAESDTNRATAETADYVFAKRTIKPKMQLIVSYLNEYLVPRYVDNMYLSFVDPVPEDKNFRTLEMQAVLGSAPAMTVNEARQNYLGLGPIDGGDTVMGVTTQTPLGTARQPAAGAPQSPKSAKKSKDANSRKVKTQFARNLTIRKDMAESLAEKISEYMKSVKKKSEDVRDMDTLTYEKEIVSKENQRISEFQKEIVNALRGLNDRQKKVVLENLERSIKGFVSKSVDVTRLLDLNSWITATVDLVKPILGNLYAKQGATAAELIGQPAINVFDSEANKEALNAAINLLGKNYQQTVVDTLKAKIDEGLKEGLGIADIKQRVQDIYQFQDEYAAERVARTEVVRVSNMANKAAWKDSGTVKTVKWYTSEKDTVCPFCESMNGTTIDINDNFADMGEKLDVGDDQSMTVDYSDIGGPPLHPNCGCYMRPETFAPIADSTATDNT